MSDIDQAALLEIIAGKTRSNTAAAILGNQVDLENAYVDALHAEGSAWRENETYLDSIQGKMDQFNNAVQTMWSDALDDEVVKFFIDLGRVLIESIDKIGLLKITFMGIGASFLKKAGIFDNPNVFTIDKVEERINELTAKRNQAEKDLLSNPSSKRKQSVFNQTDSALNSYKSVFEPQLQEYNELQKKLDLLKEKRDNLLSNMKSKPDSWTNGFKQQIDGIDDEIKKTEQSLGKFTSGFQDARKASDAAGNGLKARFTSIGTSIKTAGVALKEFTKDLLAMYAVTTIIEALSWGFNKIKQTIEDNSNLWNNLDQKFNDSRNEVDNLNEDINQLNTELEENQSRIDELLSQGTLEYVDQEELSRLQSISAELKTQIELKKALKDTLQQTTNENAIAASNAYLNQTSFGSEQTKLERQEEAEETGKVIGSVVGGILAIGLGTLLAPETGGLSLAAALAWAGGGALVGGGIGSITGSTVSGASYNSEQSVGEAIKSINSQRQNYINQQNQALAKQDVEAYNEAIEALNNYDQKMAEHMRVLSDYYNAFDWTLATTEQKEAMEQNANILDAYNISMGTAGAKTAAFDRLLNGPNASKGMKQVAKNWKLLSDGVATYSEQSEILNDTAKNSLKDLSSQYNNVVNGNVDYSKRPFVSPEKMKERYPQFDGDIATTWDTDEIYDVNGEVKYTVKFTPILENGEVLDTDSYRQYIEEVFAAIDQGGIEAGLAYDAQNKKLLINYVEGAVKYDENNFSEIDSALAEIKNKHYDIYKQAISFAEVFRNSFDTEEEYNAALNQLHEMGLTLVELEARLTEVKKAEEEAMDFSSFYGAQSFTGVTDGVAAIKEAMADFNEQGFISASTLIELNETFKDFNSWKGFVDVVSSATSTMKEAEEAAKTLLDELLNKRLSQGPITDIKEYVTLLSNLASIGVKNPKEYLDSLQTTSMISDIAADVTKNPNQSQDDIIKKYQEQYEIELQGEQDKLILEKAITAEKSQQIAIEAEAQQKSYDAAVQQQEILKERKQALEAQLSSTEYYTEKYTGNSFARPYNYYDPQGNRITKDEYNSVPDNLKMDGKKREELQKELDALQKELDNTKIPVKPTLDVSEVKQQAEDAVNEYQAALDESGLTVDIELISPTENVDNIQAIFDTLGDAQREYNENGYFTVDTMQSLLALEPQYLSLLYDENGSLNLNKEALYQIAVARINDMMLKQQDAILSEAEQVAMQGTIDKLYAQVDATYDMANAEDVLIQKRLESISAIIEERKALADDDPNKLDANFDTSAYISGVQQQLNATRWVAQSAIQNLNNTLSSSGKNTKKAADEAAKKAKEDASKAKEDKFKKEMEYWDNRIEANRAKYDQIQNDIDLLEKKGKIAGESYYQNQMKIEKERLNLLNGQKKAATAYLKTFKEGSDEWWEAAKQLNDIEGEIDDVTASVQDLKDAMDEVKWKIFEESHERFDDLISQLDSVRNLLSANEDNLFDEEGNFTEDGIAVLATYIQSIEIYKNSLADVNKEIKNLKLSDFDSEQEYYDKLSELTEKQRDYAESVSDSEQSVVEMYENQIDAIEKYTDKLKDSYSEYIDMVKDALDAERDLYDFKRSIEDKNKNVSDLERKISALSGSTSREDIAERRRLEAELTDARKDLDDTYYDHSINAQNNALDRELDEFQDFNDKYVKGLRDTLKQATRNMTNFLSNIATVLTFNAGTISQKYSETGLTMDAALTQPWVNAEKQTKKYGVDGLALMNSWVQPGGMFSNFQIKATAELTAPWQAAQKAMTTFQDNMKQQMNNITQQVKSNVAQMNAAMNNIQTTANRVADSASSSSGGSSGGYYGNTGTTTTKKDTVVKIGTAASDTAYVQKGATKTVNGTSYTNVGGVWYKSSQISSSGIIKQNSEAFSINGSKPSTRFEKDAYDGHSIKKGRNYKFAGASYTIDGNWIYIKTYNDQWIRYGDADTIGKDGAHKIVGALQSSQGWTPQSDYPIYWKKYAKGTISLNKDQWAITDEPQYGDELTLVPGKDGNLSFMRKGTGVVPADLTERLFELAQMSPNDMGNSIVNAMVPNVETNNQAFNINFDALVKADNITNDVLPEVERMVSKQLDSFTKKLNYAIKQYR